MTEREKAKSARRVYQWVVDAIKEHLYSEEALVQYQFDNLLDFE